MARCYLIFTQVLALLTARVWAADTYQLDTAYSGSNFFEGFDFYTGTDPTHGFVDYVSSSEAASLGLAIPFTDGPAYIGVDYTSVLSPSGLGRKSVRINTKKAFTHGLFITDIEHMPGGICGTWPAFWMFGPNWPNAGEIDIIEGVNSGNDNLMSLHTSSGCTIAGTGQTGTLQTNNCDSTTNNGAGCGSTASGTKTYGSDFNANGGGVYATEWTSDHISVWFFPRGNIPVNIQSGKPDPTTWGIPQANFQGSCNIDQHFYDHNIVFDTTFCGDWAGNVWQYDSVCKNLATSCTNYVASDPGAFKNAYWMINYLNVYELKPALASSAKSTSSAASSKKSSSSTKTSVSSKKPASSIKSSSKHSSSSTGKMLSTIMKSSTASYKTSSTASKKMASTKVSSTLKSHTLRDQMPTQVAFFPSNSSTIAASVGSDIPIPEEYDPVVTSNLPSASPTLDLGAAGTLVQLPSVSSAPSTYVYLGCYNSQVNADSTSFSYYLSGNGMDVETCINECATQKFSFAALRGFDCACANNVNTPDNIQEQLESCNTPCPGNPAEVCGSVSVAVNKRKSESDILSVYRNLELSGEPEPSGTVTLSLESETLLIPSATSSASATAEEIAPTRTSTLIPALTSSFPLIGCFLSTIGTTQGSGFLHILSGPKMDIEICIQACTSQQNFRGSFVGLYETKCFCASNLNREDNELQSSDQCELRCPGDSNELCGGTAVPALKHNSAKKRQIKNILLSVYANLELPVLNTTSAVSKLVTISVTPTYTGDTSYSSAIPASSIFGVGMGGGIDPDNYISTILITTYIDICTCTESTLTTFTHTTTLSYCGCKNDTNPNPNILFIPASTTPAIPMVTTTKICGGCGENGGESMVTLVVPYISTPNSNLVPIPVESITHFEVISTAVVIPVQVQIESATTTPPSNPSLGGKQSTGEGSTSLPTQPGIINGTVQGMGGKSSLLWGSKWAVVFCVVFGFGFALMDF